MLKLFVVSFGILLNGLFSVGAVCAQTYPSKAIRFIVPWPVGGAADSVGRAIAQALTRELGQNVFVENIAGAGGNIGTQQFVRQGADGYTLYLATSSTNVANPYLYKKLGFEPVKDFSPIGLVASIPSVLVVSEASRIKTLGDLLADTKARPGKATFGSGGVGASAHLAGELFKSLTHADVIHVPYKGSGPAMTDLIGGQLDYMFDTGAFPYLKGGRVRALAVAAMKRHPLLPNVPTAEEAGVKGMIMNAWYGVAAPAGTPAEITSKINLALNTAINKGELSANLAGLGAEVRTGTIEEFSKYWVAELKRYEALVKLTGASLD